MSLVNLKPKIFQQFSAYGLRTFFVIGGQEATLAKLRKKFDLASMEQVHGSNALEVKNRLSKVYEGDALFTSKLGIYLAVRSADCLPILFYNPKKQIIGVVHAGWKGTYKKIIQKTLQKVAKRFQAKPEDFYFYLGPAARLCCYEITHEPQRIEKFDKKYRKKILRKDGARIFLDIVKANKLQLRQLHVPTSHIEDSGLCTIHNAKYPSHRREGEGRKETLLSLVGLR